MDAAIKTLAQQAIKCKGWRWMPGMLSTCGRRISWVSGAALYQIGGLRDGDTRARPDNGPLFHNALPDFDDPATVGCLLALVREAHEDPCVYVAPCAEKRADGTSPIWFVYTGRGKGPIATGPTEAVALLAALEAAP